MEIPLYILFVIISTAALALGSVKLLTILQQSGYQIQGVVSWIKQTNYSVIVRFVSFFIVTSGLMLIFNFGFGGYDGVHFFSMIIYAAVSLLFVLLQFIPRAKVPLRLTPRMIRLYAVVALLCLAASVGALFLSMLEPLYETVFAFFILLIPALTFLAHCILLPFERLNANRHIKLVKAKLEARKENGLIIIGITGSYGKTTTKNILHAMLSAKFRTCGGTGSFNTPLGLCRVVNEKLKDDDQILIAEMGARRVGDIAELCEIAPPDIAVITSVGCQHLEAFGSLENIAKGKYELIEGLRGDIASFNGDDSGAKKLYDKCQLEGKILCGGASLSAENSAQGSEKYAPQVSYSNVTCGKFGSRFTLDSPSGSTVITTPLLGDYVPSLICLAGAVALKLGVSLEDIAMACASLKPVPHRLELTQNGDTYIIDDSYNANTSGALCALKVLSGFDCRKIIITPGLVELGRDEKTANTAFGKAIAAYADIAILVGSRGTQMKEGALSAGMPDTNIYRVKTLDEATTVLTEFNGEKAVLFENDLTDSYV